MICISPLQPSLIAFLDIDLSSVHIQPIRCRDCLESGFCAVITRIIERRNISSSKTIISSHVRLWQPVWFTLWYMSDSPLWYLSGSSVRCLSGSPLLYPVRLTALIPCLAHRSDTLFGSPLWYPVWLTVLILCLAHCSDTLFGSPLWYISAHCSDTCLAHHSDTCLAHCSDTLSGSPLLYPVWLAALIPCLDQCSDTLSGSPLSYPVWLPALIPCLAHHFDTLCDSNILNDIVTYIHSNPQIQFTGLVR